MEKVRRKCPFCESHNMGIMSQLNDLRPPVTYFVFCWKCRARGPEAQTENEAIKLWNGICKILSFKKIGMNEVLGGTDAAKTGY